MDFRDVNLYFGMYGIWPWMEDGPWGSPGSPDLDLVGGQFGCSPDGVVEVPPSVTWNSVRNQLTYLATSPKQILRVGIISALCSLTECKNSHK